MKKASLAFLLLCCIIFSACQKGSSHASSFSLEVTAPTTKMVIRDTRPTRTYTIELKNLTEQAFPAEHGASTLRMYMYPKGRRASPLAFGSSYAFGAIEPHETITRTLSFFPKEEGDYILEVWCELAIDGEIVRIDAEKTLVTVVLEFPRKGWLP